LGIITNRLIKNILCMDYTDAQKSAIAYEYSVGFTFLFYGFCTGRKVRAILSKVG
jgi:hypothetical protein